MINVRFKRRSVTGENPEKEGRKLYKELLTFIEKIRGRCQKV
jgi:hypothetical protein